MAVDTPARIAIIGAGPVGLEAALYARFLGYDVDLYERDQPASRLRQLGHMRLFPPFAQIASPLGLAALQAQQHDFRPLPADAQLTAAEAVERYFQPLAECDLLSDCLRLGEEVLSIFREVVPDQPAGCADLALRRETDFRLQLVDPQGQPRAATAEVVIDTSGLCGAPLGLGPDGRPVPGEADASSVVDRELPDLLGAARSHYAGRTVAVVGAGLAAATAVLNLIELRRQEPGTKVVWLVRSPLAADGSGPVREIPADPWPERAQLARAANQVARSAAVGTNLAPGVDFLSGTAIESLRWSADEQKLHLGLWGSSTTKALMVDRLVAAIGHRPDVRLYRDLLVSADSVTGAVQPSPDPRQQLLSFETWEDEQGNPLDAADPAIATAFAPAPAALAMVLPEPDFYVLGSKSAGRGRDFAISQGWEQVRALFSLLGDRPELDLYANMRRMLHQGTRLA